MLTSAGALLSGSRRCGGDAGFAGGVAADTVDVNASFCNAFKVGALGAHRSPAALKEIAGRNLCTAATKQREHVAVEECGKSGCCCSCTTEAKNTACSLCSSVHTASVLCLVHCANKTVMAGSFCSWVQRAWS